MTSSNGASAPVLYKPDEAAERLRVCRTTVFQLLRDGELESIVVGKRRRLIPADSIAAYIDRLRGHGTTDAPEGREL
jgi:excisionase family DNA binding protein